MDQEISNRWRLLSQFSVKVLCRPIDNTEQYHRCIRYLWWLELSPTSVIFVSEYWIGWTTFIFETFDCSNSRNTHSWYMCYFLGIFDIHIYNFFTFNKLFFGKKKVFLWRIRFFKFSFSFCPNKLSDSKQGLN